MGSHLANYAIMQCELLIVVGCNFAWKEFYPDVPIIKIDKDSTKLSSHITVDVPICGNADLVITKLNQSIMTRSDESFIELCRSSLRKYLDEFSYQKKENKKILHPARVVKAVSDNLEYNSIVCGDSGSTTIWFNNIAKMVPPQRFLWGANLASLGCSLGHSIGAHFASGLNSIYLIAGDGGFQMTICDLVTVAMYRVPVKCFILNNSSFKFIEFEEQSHDGNVASGTRLLNPDYAAMAESCHIKGFRVENEQDFKSVFDFISENPEKPVVVDCIVDKDALLIPSSVSSKMAYNYVKSEIKSWFTPDTNEDKLIEAFLKDSFKVGN